MADIHPVIETMEHRWMRAWVTGDMKTLKALTSRNFRMVIGSKPAMILDSKSWLEAAGKRYRCESYRFGDVYARDIGGSGGWLSASSRSPTSGLTSRPPSGRCNCGASRLAIRKRVG